MAFKDQIPDESKELFQEYNLVEQVKKYIAENLPGNLNAGVVSQKFELSVSSLQHLFKKHVGVSYHHYLEDTRMNKAFEMIVKERKRVQQTMYATGYKYKSSFNKAFKRKFKYPPAHFLK